MSDPSIVALHFDVLFSILDAVCDHRESLFNSLLAALVLSRYVSKHRSQNSSLPSKHAWSLKQSFVLLLNHRGSQSLHLLEEYQDLPTRRDSFTLSSVSISLSQKSQDIVGQGCLFHMEEVNECIEAVEEYLLSVPI